MFVADEVVYFYQISNLENKVTEREIKRALKF